MPFAQTHTKASEQQLRHKLCAAFTAVPFTHRIEVVKSDRRMETHTHAHTGHGHGHRHRHKNTLRKKKADTTLKHMRNATEIRQIASETISIVVKLVRSKCVTRHTDMRRTLSLTHTWAQAVSAEQLPFTAGSLKLGHTQTSPIELNASVSGE